MRLNTLIRKVERLQSELVPIVRKACEKEKETIVNLNRAQLQRGENADGVLMNGGEYSMTGAAKRMAKGLPIDHVYLRETGGLQDGMNVEFTETGFSVITTDWKQQLVDEVMRTGYWPSSGYNAPFYGPVFGLDAVSMGILVWNIKPRVTNGVRGRLLS